MNGHSLAKLDDATLLRQLSALVAGERSATAVILVHIAEVDLRRLYLPAAYSSMYAYCVGALGLSEGAAFRRVQSARAARRFPALFDAVASGRLHLTAISMLAPHLRESNADELIASAATCRSRSELQAWLARRFPAESAILPPAQVRVIGVATSVTPSATPLPLAPSLPTASMSATPSPEVEANLRAELTHKQPNSPIPGEVNWAVAPPATPPALAPRPGEPAPRPAQPLAQPYFVLKVALGESTHAKLERAQVLLAHSVRVGQVADVLDRALDALLSKLERRRGAAEPGRERPPRTERTDGRGIPAAVRREVWARDGGRCTFKGAAGRQCEADRGLEFDHVRPVARGGDSTAANLRLRCRAHNQLEAERAFGREFMRQKRGEAPGDAARS
jgi:5-methylcytosine-specific restriction endonuclease McrA